MTNDSMTHILISINQRPLGKALPAGAPAGPAPTISTDSCSAEPRRPGLGASEGSTRRAARRCGAAAEGDTKPKLTPGELGKQVLFGFFRGTPLNMISG